MRNTITMLKVKDKAMVRIDDIHAITKTDTGLKFQCGGGCNDVLVDDCDFKDIETIDYTSNTTPPGQLGD
jgi:hypothetical protein